MGSNERIRKVGEGEGIRTWVGPAKVVVALVRIDRRHDHPAVSDSVYKEYNPFSVLYYNYQFDIGF
jgi:hypothetical protein